MQSMGIGRLFGFGQAASDPAARAESFVEDNTAFALDLYSRLKGNPGNLFFSPFSISTGLAMTYAGARGDTETQMSRVLHFTKGNARIHSSFGALQRQLHNAATEKGIQLAIANLLWGQEGHPFLPDFLRIATDEYQANVNQADFKTGADAVTAEINRWVAEKTHEKIQDILPPGSLDEVTRLVLANAIYFKGAWASLFEVRATSIQPFLFSRKSRIDVSLMRQTDDFNYAGNKDFQAVELPYRGNDLSMMILLPRRIDGCGQLENRLTPALLSSTLAQMQTQKVEVYFPRFKLESSLDLKDTLAKMGMPDVFVWPHADLSGLDGAKDLFISNVFHKAWGEINEAGTEAAATTAVMVMLGCDAGPPPAPPPVFRADHPFIFLIRDTRSGSLLFLGRLADPSK